MKITVNLSDAEVKGIKKYNLICFGEKMNKTDFTFFINSLVSSSLHSSHEGVSDYIEKAEKEENRNIH